MTAFTYCKVCGAREGVGAHYSECAGIKLAAKLLEALDAYEKGSSVISLRVAVQDMKAEAEAVVNRGRKP